MRNMLEDCTKYIKEQMKEKYPKQYLELNSNPELCNKRLGTLIDKLADEYYSKEVQK